MHQEDYMQPKEKNGRFYMPYRPNFPSVKLWDIIKLISSSRNDRVPTKNDFKNNEYLSQRDASDSADNTCVFDYKQQMKYTWLGHATMLVSIAGFNFLFDPIFSETNAGPLFPTKLASYFNLDRKVPLPFKSANMKELVDKLPKIHAVFISHDHYDHLDMATCVCLKQRFGNELLFVTFLNYGDLFAYYDIFNVVCMNWNEKKIISLSKKTNSISIGPREYELDEDEIIFEVMGLPAQHWCGRMLIDYNRRLWGSWLVSLKHSNLSFYFAGDTSYGDQYLDDIKSKNYNISVASIPIGAYKPREVLQSKHIDPEQAVLIHKKLSIKQSVAMHWGTFALGREHMFEPVAKLTESKEKHNVNADSFTPVKLGYTNIFS